MVACVCTYTHLALHHNTHDLPTTHILFLFFNIHFLSHKHTKYPSIKNAHIHACQTRTYTCLLPHIMSQTYHTAHMSVLCRWDHIQHRVITLCYTILQMWQKLHFPFSHTYTHNTDTRRHHTLNYAFLSQPIYHNPHLPHVCCAQTWCIRYIKASHRH